MSSETAAVHLPADDAVLSFAWLTEALASSAGWREGAVRVLGATRIGEAHGFSGRIHRISIEATNGRPSSLVVKEESADGVERELRVRRYLGESALGAVARCYFGAIDTDAGRGVLVLEDIAPAVQGDVLEGCSRERADAAVRTLARLHAASWTQVAAGDPPDLPRWPAEPMATERWRDRPAHAGTRLPEVLTAECVARLRDLPTAVGVSLARLRNGPEAWIHADAHLDNILWRSDGSAVFLDWCDASVGPPAVDVALCLSDGVAPALRQSLIAAYAGELERHGVEYAAADAETHVVLVLPYLLQGLIGWAGRTDFTETGRSAAVCRSSLRSVSEWVDATGSLRRAG